MAARGLPLPVATIGTGFCCPPDVSPLPDFRPWMPDGHEQIRRDEAGVLERINQLLLGWDQAPLDRLAAPRGADNRAEPAFGNGHL